MNTLRCVVIGLAGSCHLGPTLVVTSISTALAAADGRSSAGCIAVGAAVLAGQLSVGWCNDAVDAPRDRASGRSDKPIAQGAISRSAVAAAAGTALVATVPLSLLSGWRATVVHLLAVTLAWGYDLGLKSTRLSVLTYAGAFGLLPIFVTLGIHGRSLPPWPVIVGAALLGAGAHLANALPDLVDDAVTGVRGLPQRLGPTWSRNGAAALLTVASTTLLVGSARWSAANAVALVAAGIVVAGLVTVVLRSGRNPAWAFRAAMALAGVDAVLLIASVRA